MNDLIDDDLWSAVARLLDRPKAGSAGRPKASDRKTLSGIVYVLRAGVPWNRLPRRLDLGSGMTCLRRLRQWQDQGRWQKIERLLKQHLAYSDEVDWQRASQTRRRPRRNPNDRPPWPAQNRLAQISTTLALGLAENFVQFP